MTYPLQHEGRVLRLLSIRKCSAGCSRSYEPICLDTSKPSPKHPHAPRAGSQVIEHVVVIFQENRSTDNLFHDKKLIANGADIASFGLNSKGQRIPAYASGDDGRL